MFFEVVEADNYFQVQQRSVDSRREPKSWEWRYQDGWMRVPLGEDCGRTWIKISGRHMTYVDEIDSWESAYLCCDMFTGYQGQGVLEHGLTQKYQCKRTVILASIGKS